MAEPQKGASSAVKLKEKDSSLGDMDFGEDFFTSWNSKTVSGDDAMDFDFGSVAKGNKKAFSFGKLDVDFSLDGDLDKISSFKMDMSDLDISSPLKKSGMTENSKKDSGDGNRQKKQDSFSFSFDFNELDTFQFEPSLAKEGVGLAKEVNKAGKNKDNEEASNKGEGQGSRNQQRDIIGASDGLTSNLSLSEGMAISEGNPKVGDLGKFDLTDLSRSLSTKEEVTSNPPPNQNSVEPVEEDMPELVSKSRPHEIVQDAMCTEEREGTQDFSIKTLSGDQATQVEHSELQAEVSSRVTEETVREKITSSERVASPERESSLLERQENSMEKLCSGDSERKNNSGDNDSISTGNKDGSEIAQGVEDSADTSSSNTSMKSIFVTQPGREYQNGKSQVRVPSPNCDTFKSIETKEKEITSVRSKYFKRPDGRESQLRQRQSSMAMFPAKLTSSKQQTDGSKDVAVIDAQGQNKVVRVPDTSSGELVKSDGEPETTKTVRGLKDIELVKSDGEPETTKTVRGLKDIGESLKTDTLLNGSKLVGFLRASEKEIKMGEPVAGPEKNNKNLVTISSALKFSTPVEKISKPITQSQATSRTVLSTVSAKSFHNSSSKEKKASTPKELRNLLDLSGLKISRALGESRPSNSVVKKQTNSSPKLMQIRELEESVPSEISPSISTEKQSRSSPSLKRKIYEALNADTPNLQPLKRFSPSPTESRNVIELLQDGKKEVRNKENIAESHNRGGYQSPTLDISREVNFADFEMPLVIESDDNVEKAEAYAKDLEDMCNMLKKKHDEAKELLVRAVVNNNNLLMLNHPIYEEKMRKIQTFAVQLMSKEIRA